MTELEELFKTQFEIWKYEKTIPIKEIEPIPYTITKYNTKEERK